MGKLGAVLACLLFAVPFGGVGVFASWAIGSTVHASWKARSWVPVPAVVESASLHESSSSDGGDTYRADGSFRYAWNGRSYTGTRLGTSVIGGTDNFDDWHQEVSSRLKAARAAGQPVTVWVNPENPAEAVFERGIRWAELLFLTPFALAFGGVGVGALVAMVLVLRGKGSETAAAGARPRPRHRGQGRPASARFLWIFAFFWNAISWPIAILVVRDIAASGEWLALFVLLFPLVGILVLWGAIATSWKSFREGRRGIEPPRPAPAAPSFAAGAERAMFDRPAGTAAAGFPASGPSRLTLPAALADVEDTGGTLTVRYRTRRRLVPAVMLLVGGLFLSLVGVLIYLAGDSVFWAAVLVAVAAIVDVSAVGMLVGRLVVSAKAGELVVAAAHVHRHPGVAAASRPDPRRPQDPLVLGQRGALFQGRRRPRRRAAPAGVLHRRRRARRQDRRPHRPRHPGSRHEAGPAPGAPNPTLHEFPERRTP